MLIVMTCIGTFISAMIARLAIELNHAHYDYYLKKLLLWENN